MKRVTRVPFTRRVIPVDKAEPGDLPALVKVYNPFFWIMALLKYLWRKLRRERKKIDFVRPSRQMKRSAQRKRDKKKKAKPKKKSKRK